MRCVSCSGRSALEVRDRLDETAAEAATRFLKDDPEGLRQLMDAVDLLAEDPRPTGTAEYGSSDLRGMHVGTG
jgi:mRNA interferase RelE/StbE